MVHYQEEHFRLPPTSSLLGLVSVIIIIILNDSAQSTITLQIWHCPTLPFGLQDNNTYSLNEW